jgi:hypothetical protein
MSKIKYSVGKGGMNRRIDTRFIQLILNQLLSSKSWFKPLDVDGICKEKTISAIQNYQIRVLNFMHPDGVIEPNRMTFNALTKSISTTDLTKHWNAAVIKSQPISIITTPLGEDSPKPLPEKLVPIPDAKPALASSKYSFPLDFIPTEDFHRGGHSRFFGASRRGSDRLHAGCDLFAPIGSPIYAMADGVISVAPYYFYDGTYAIEINHNNKIFRYGEMLPNATINPHLKFLPELKAGLKVNKGDVIGYVGKLVNYQHTMLHMEMYSGSSKGPLTDRSAPNLYRRRRDITDPTNILEGAKSYIPKKHDKLDNQLILNAISYSTKVRSTRAY